MSEMTKIQDMFMKLDERVQKVIVELIEFHYNAKAKLPDNVSIYDDSIQKMVSSGFALDNKKTLDSLESEDSVTLISETNNNEITSEEQEDFDEFEQIANEAKKEIIETKVSKGPKGRKPKITKDPDKGILKRTLGYLEELKIAKDFKEEEKLQKAKEFAAFVDSIVIEKKIKYKDWNWKKVIAWANELGYPERKIDKVKGVTPKAQLFAVILHQNGLL